MALTLSERDKKLFYRGVVPVRELVNRFMKDESGATAIEYGLIASLISVAILAAAGNLGKTVGNTFGKVQTNMATK